MWHVYFCFFADLGCLICVVIKLTSGMYDRCGFMVLMRCLVCITGVVSLY